MSELKMGVYKHYKGGKYLVLGVAGSSDSRNEGQLMVVYVCLYTNKGGPYMRVRSLEEFTGIVSAEIGPRFKYIGDDVKG